MKSSYNPAVNPLPHRASAYDALGNIVSETTPSWTYSYDAENRMISATGANAESYVYDAIGRRVKLINNGGVRLYFYDLGGHPMTATDSGGNRYRSEIYLGEMHLATYANSKTYFSHTNLIGTARVITDETGAVNNNCSYWPFGDWQSCSNGTPITPIGYAGYEHDPETGLDHMWFRYYNSRLGRFMSADPLGGSIGDPQSLNRFAYVNNDPANMFDPLGLFGYQGHPSDACPGAQDVRDPTAGSCIVNGIASSCSAAMRIALRGHGQSLLDLYSTPRIDNGCTDSVWCGGGDTIEPASYLYLSVPPRNVGSISNGTLDDLNDHCSARGRAKFVAEWLPGGRTIARTLWGSHNGAQLGIRQLSTADLNSITEENSGGKTVAMHAANESLKAAAGSTAFLSWLRGATGVPKTLARTWLGRLSIGFIFADASSGFYKEGKEIRKCQAGN